MQKNEKSILQDVDFLNDLIVGIGEVARITGIPARQIRYWEEKGIISSADIQDSKTRCYDYLQIKKIILIKELMDDGYSLDGAAKKVEDRMVEIEKVFEVLKKSPKNQ